MKTYLVMSTPMCCGMILVVIHCIVQWHLPAKCQSPYVEHKSSKCFICHNCCVSDLSEPRNSSSAVDGRRLQASRRADADDAVQLAHLTTVRCCSWRRQVQCPRSVGAVRRCGTSVQRRGVGIRETSRMQL